MDISKKDIIAPDGIAVIDREKKIIAFNDAAQRITGFSEEDLIYQDLTVLFPKTVNDHSYILDALTTEKTYSNLPLNIRSARDDTLSVLASINPLRPPGKKAIGVVLVFRDTREMAFLAKALREKTQEILDKKNQLEAIFNSRVEGTFTIDKSWAVTSFNSSAERITGFSAGEAVGKKCWEIFDSPMCRRGCHMELTMESQLHQENNELFISHQSGRQIPVRVNSAPLFNGTGEQIGGVETFQDISEIKNLETHLEERYHFENLVGHSKSMQKVYTLMENVIESDSTVLITGESGTGKELVARAIHLHSKRRLGPFVAINCSAFVETLLESELFGHEKGSFTGAVRAKPGRFEIAHRGTLFLDEIGDVSPTVQVKLLRVLETREFERVGGTKPIQMDVRIIAATNKDLLEQIRAGRFREDLYYRLDVINIELPPLRDRMEDLPLLIDHFLKKFRRKFNKPIKGISKDAFQLLNGYHWPGNIRELENVLEHAFVLCHDQIINPECIPERVGRNSQPLHSPNGGESGHDPLKNAEKSLIQKTLKKYDGHRGKTAQALKIDKSTLWRKMKKFGLL